VRATGAGVATGAEATAASTGLGFARFTAGRRGRVAASGLASRGSSGCETVGAAETAGAALGLRAGFAGAGSSAAGAAATFLAVAFFAATFLGAGGGAGTSALALTAFLAGARLGLAAAGSGKVVWVSSLMRVLKRG
jgi:hypothetical protein